MKKTLLLLCALALAACQRERLVIMETTLGTIELRLYDKTPLHRVIRDFMIQGG